MLRKIAVTFVLLCIAMTGFAQSNTSNAAEQLASEGNSGYQEHPNLMVLHADVPTYPPLARQVNIPGTVEAVVTVNDGSVEEVHVSRGPGILANAATESIKSWRFNHYVNARFTTRFVYRLTRRGEINPNGKVMLQLPLLVEIESAALRKGL